MDPFKAEGDVLHLGIAGSIETPRGYSDGRGVSFSHACACVHARKPA